MYETNRSRDGDLVRVEHWIFVKVRAVVSRELLEKRRRL